MEIVFTICSCVKKGKKKGSNATTKMKAIFIKYTFSIHFISLNNLNNTKIGYMFRKNNP